MLLKNRSITKCYRTQIYRSKIVVYSQINLFISKGLVKSMAMPRFIPVAEISKMEFRFCTEK